VALTARIARRQIAAHAHPVLAGVGPGAWVAVGAHGPVGLLGAAAVHRTLATQALVDLVRYDLGRHASVVEHVDATDVVLASACRWTASMVTIAVEEFEALCAVGLGL